MGYVDGASLYQYVTGNPITMRDYLGLQCGEASPGQYRTGSPRYVYSQPGFTPEEIDDRMASAKELRELLKSMYKLSDPSKIAKGMAKSAEKLISEGAGDYLEDKIKEDLKNKLKEPLPSASDFTKFLEKMIDMSDKVIDNYMKQRLKNAAWCWLEVPYQIAGKCCPTDPSLGEWGPIKIKRVRVQESELDNTYSSNANIEPSFQAKNAAMMEATNQIMQEAQGAK